jgi:hypothetical protein
MPTALRSLDDRVLGDRGRKRSRSRDDSAEPRHDGDRQDGDRQDGDRQDTQDPYQEERREVTTRGKAAPKGRGSTGDGLKQFLTIFYRVAKAVFLLLSLVVILGIVFILAPTNDDNVIVQNVLDLADAVAGPFRDVFTADDAEREMVINYGLAAGVYFLAAMLVTKLPSGKG